VRLLAPYTARESVVVSCVFRLLRGTPDPHISPWEHSFMVGTAFAIVRNGSDSGLCPIFSEDIAFTGE